MADRRHRRRLSRVMWRYPRAAEAGAVPAAAAVGVLLVVVAAASRATFDPEVPPLMEAAAAWLRRSLAPPSPSPFGLHSVARGIN